MELTKRPTWFYNSCLVACLSQTLGHKSSKPLHTFLSITLMIAYQQNSHTWRNSFGRNRESPRESIYTRARTTGNEREAIIPDRVDSTMLW